jgi:RHS repeat-associated protein
MSCVQIPHRPPPRGGAACGEASFSQHLWDWLAYRGAALSGYDGSWDDWWSGSWLWFNYAFAVHDTGYTGPWGRWRDNGGYEDWIEYRIAIYEDGYAGTWDDWMADTGLIYPDPTDPAALPYDEMTAWVQQAQWAAVRVALPPVAFTVNAAPRHDADGNQTIVRTSAGVWHVTYNADNRPVCYSNDTAVVTLGYDYFGRCFRRTVSGWGPASSEFQVSSFQRYLYRGHLRIATLDMLNGDAVIHPVVWDPAEQTATRPLLLQTPSGWFTYGFDQTKNVTELFDPTGSTAATYDFGPFGENMTASTPAAALNHFRFSSEVWDAILGLIYYNWRHYNPAEGRFVSRDPIHENGGINLYWLVLNCPTDMSDRLGLKEYKVPDCTYEVLAEHGFTDATIKKYGGMIPPEVREKSKVPSDIRLGKNSAATVVACNDLGYILIRDGDGWVLTDGGIPDVERSMTESRLLDTANRIQTAFDGAKKAAAANFDKCKCKQGITVKVTCFFTFFDYLAGLTGDVKKKCQMSEVVNENK